ncbi:MAG: hypothetical protein K0S65_2668 [Labilithrix sp.]|nr:hypothetical protein [Labilithrix sp.]
MSVTEPQAAGPFVGRGDWMQTYTGKAFYPLAPVPADVDIHDIAHALSMLCRYNGHTGRFYSVAEHCVHLSRYVSPENALWALLHDAPEAYIGDMIRPLKKYMPDFQWVDDNLTAVIALRYNLEGTLIPAEVKEADTRILINERAALHRTPPREWDVPGEPLEGVTIEAWSPERAEAEYLGRFHELVVSRG